MKTHINIIKNFECWLNVPVQILAKSPLAKCPLAKCPLPKCPLAKCPLAKCPGFVLKRSDPEKTIINSQYNTFCLST